jgi:RNA polymerase sigma-70 factor (ECF subfamily)
MAAVPSIGRASAVTPRPASQGARATHDLYERYARQIYNYCLHQLGNREEAEDATQSTFLNAFRGLERGISPEFESAWLFKIAQNVCLTRRRSSFRRRRVESPGDLDAMQDMLPSRERDADELLRLTEALQDMPEQQRRALLLREWQGLSYKEIGDELELSQAAVETLLFRARRSLANGLVDETRPKERTLRSRLRAGSDLGSVLAVVKTLFFSGGAKVVASVATVAATGAVAASPEVRHDVARIVQPVVAPKHKPTHVTKKPAAQHHVTSHSSTPVSVVAPAAAKPERRALVPAKKPKVRVGSKAASAPPAYALKRHGVTRTPVDEARPAVTPAASTPTPDPVVPAPVEQQPAPVQPAAETPQPVPTPPAEQPKQVEPAAPAVPTPTWKRDMRKADSKSLPTPATTPSVDRRHSDNVGRKDPVERTPSNVQPVPATDPKQDRRQESHRPDRPTSLGRDRADNIHWTQDRQQDAQTPASAPTPVPATTPQPSMGRRGRDVAPPTVPTLPSAPTTPAAPTPAVPTTPSLPDDRNGRRDRRPTTPPAVPAPPAPVSTPTPAAPPPAPVAPAPAPVAPPPAQPAPRTPVVDLSALASLWPMQGHRR